MNLEPGILVHARLDDYVILHYFVYGFRQDPTFRLVREIARAGDTVVDVGANVGLWLMGVAQRVGEGGEVHAFEPLPHNFHQLEAHLEQNGLAWVQAHEMALSDEAGVARLLVPPGGNSGAGSLARKPGGASVAVPVTTLDEFCQQRGLSRVDLLKVDVEGAELKVFRGAQRLLASPGAPIIMFEVGESLAAGFGASTSEVKRCLTAFGYGVYRYSKGVLVSVPNDEVHPTPEDLLALRPAHAGERPRLAGLLLPHARGRAV